MRRFYLDREVDLTGTSGTGVVLEGVETPSRRVIVEWVTPIHSIEIFESLAEFKEIHHVGVVDHGENRLIWLDD